MTAIHSIIYKIKRELISTFAVLDSLFDHEQVLAVRPGSRWTVAEILEHISLANHYLLLLIEKASRHAVRKAASGNLTDAVSAYSFEHALLAQVSSPEAFRWERPDHMEPIGEKPLQEIRHELRVQLYRCICVLDELPNGEGILQKTMLSVNGVGKLDVYQYLYFLVLHSKRHLNMIASIKEASSTPSIAADVANSEELLA